MASSIRMYLQFRAQEGQRLVVVLDLHFVSCPPAFPDASSVLTAATRWTDSWVPSRTPAHLVELIGE